jgi:hypothetical protein
LRITFVGVAKRVRNYGYNVELMKIDVIDPAPAIAPAATVSAPPDVYRARQPAGSTGR